MLTIKYFNPVVKDWTPECQTIEISQRKSCDYVLYTITPQMEGVYSIAEAVDDSNKQPKKTIFCVLSEYGGKEFSKGQLKSLRSTATMIKENGGFCCTTLQEVVDVVTGDNDD
jgi:hypothetical protein